jgi:hypothetical protein
MTRLAMRSLWKTSKYLLVLALLMVGCAANGLNSGQGTVEGHTLSIVAGIPGALSGHPDRNWRRPEPKVAPNERVYFLMVDKEKKPKLFSTVSDGRGAYKIALPEGGYFIEAAIRKTGWGIEELEKKGDQKAIIDILLVFSAQRDSKGEIVSTREPDVVVKAGQTAQYDVPAEVMHVD